MTSSEHKVKVVLHGHLKDKQPVECYFSGATAAEVINGFCKQTGVLDVPMGEEKHCISVVGFETQEALFSPLPANVTELHLVPALIGGKSGGFFRIVIGAVLIASVIATGGLTGTFGVTLWGSTMLSEVMINMGISLILGGLISMLSPAPKIDTTGDSESDPEASKYLGATGNSVRVGTRIPLLYGEFKLYGHYLSFDVDAKDVAV